MAALGCVLLLVGAVPAAMGVQSAVAAGSITMPSASFFMIQLTDPQFGLEYSCFTGVEPGCASGWPNEQAMLNESIRLINRLRPRFVVLTGDMQNSHPNSSDAMDARQTAAVKRVLALLDPSIPLRATIPGNHDIDDRPTLATLKLYGSRWGADRAAFETGGVRFLAVDSQLYVDARAPGVGERAAEQTRWLSDQLDAASAKGVVLLTHVPPFVVSADEPAGWANWDVAARHEVLRMTQSKAVPPSLIVGGHFHANVEDVHSSAASGGATTAASGAPFEVVTSSAVGCAIAWNGSEVASFPHPLAAAIAAQPNGAEAFQMFILRNGSMAAPADPSLISARIVASPNRSGVRLFEFSATAGYRHRFYTLRELGALVTKTAPLATGASSPLADRAFTPWTTRGREPRGGHERALEQRADDRELSEQALQA